MVAQTWIGIDVSKSTIDVCLLRETGKGILNAFANNAHGHQSLVKWARGHSIGRTIHFCMEATGTYHVALATFLADSDELVSVVNPSHIKYSGPDGASNRTDKAAARKIADFARRYAPQRWTPPPVEKRILVGLVRHLDTLIEDQTRLKIRLQTPELIDQVRHSLSELVATVETQIADIKAEIAKHIDRNDGLRLDRDLLLSIDGIGEITAQRLLAELPEMDACHSGASAAAHAGLSPKEHQSGTSVFSPTKLSKHGNPRLRRAVYFPAITAIRHNPIISALANRLAERGKSKMAIIGAAMRKLVMLAYGVLKSRRPFDPNYVARNY